MDKNSRIGAAIKLAYYDLRSPAAFSSIRRVFEQAKKNNSNVRYEDVQQFLQQQRTYTLHRPKRKRFPRLQTVPTGLGEWQCDLAIFDKLSSHNDGYRYMLVCIDILSRKIVVAPVRSKRSDDMIAVFELVFKKA